MPELPEVQTIVSELNQKIAGKKIQSIEVWAEKSVYPSGNIFISSVVGKNIKEVSRRAKMIIISLSNKKFLLIHLKMTGQLVFIPQKGKVVVGGHPIDSQALPSKFTRVSFGLSNGYLHFNDIRRFGWIKLVSEDEKNSLISVYGLEPLEKDFTLNAFKKIIEKYPNRKIKQSLLDQSLIAGIGNIYADEACFLAGIMPTRIVESLTNEELKKLFLAIPKILKLSIKMKGTSSANYITSDGSKGKMVKFLNVYGRVGKQCTRCDATISKIKLNGRGTQFCPYCQK